MAERLPLSVLCLRASRLFEKLARQFAAADPADPPDFPSLRRLTRYAIAAHAHEVLPFLENDALPWARSRQPSPASERDNQDAFTP